MAADANRRVRVTASARRNEWPVARQAIQFDTEMAAPDRLEDGPQLARGVYSDQSANGSRANRAMACFTGKDEIVCLPLVGKEALRLRGRKTKKNQEKPFL